MYGLIGSFVDRINRGLAPVLYGGKQSSDFTYIKDVVEANFLALTSSWDKWNQVYNIGTGEEISSKKAGKIICDVMKYSGELKVEAPRIVDAERFVYDTSKAEKMLGFKAKYDFATGLKETLQEESVIIK
jgi:nucleoside-diphosphate-sugar epimerase